MDKDIFTLIKSENDKIKLWKDLGSAKGEIICKGKDDGLCKVRATFYNSATQCLEATFENKVTMANQEEYLGYFFLGGEKYYFQSIAQATPVSLIIPIPPEVYHLQRRQNYRVRIPEIYSASFNIVKINDNALQDKNSKGQLADLSSQGCRVIYRNGSPLMKMGDKIVGHLMLKDRSPIEVQGVIRHVKSEEGSKVAQTFGIEFTPLPPILESKLFALTLELHKEIFKRPQ